MDSCRWFSDTPNPTNNVFIVFVRRQASFTSMDGTLPSWKSFLVAILAIAILWQLYQIAPLANLASFLPQWRILGLILAALTFLASNLFLQIPVSAARILVTNDTEFAALEPLSLEKIKQDFTIFGVRVNHILPQRTVKVETEE